MGSRDPERAALVVALAAAPAPHPEYQYDPPLPPTGLSRSEFETWLHLRARPVLRPPDSCLRKAFDARLGWPAGTKVAVAIVGPPRVTGIAFPKFYVWVHATDAGGRLLAEGAARDA